MAQRSRSSSAQVAPQRWPLIQDLAAAGPWSLLVVVHGHGGGAVPAVLQSLLDELAQARGAAVWVQALTAERRTSYSRPQERRPERRAHNSDWQSELDADFAAMSKVWQMLRHGAVRMLGEIGRQY